MIGAVCDYCRREFGYEPGAAAICLHCGLENTFPPPKLQPAFSPPVVEAAMLPGAPERAVQSSARPRSESSLGKLRAPGAASRAARRKKAGIVKAGR